MQELESEAPAICKIINNLNNLFLISLRSNDFFQQLLRQSTPCRGKEYGKAVKLSFKTNNYENKYI